MMLAGKWVWSWNWPRCVGEGGDASHVAERLKSVGCKGALLKAFDGPRWFDQERPWRDIGAELKANGVSVRGWGYCYGSDPVDEAQRAIETARYGRSDLLVLDVEAEFKGRPQAAEELCRRIRDALGPEYPLYFSSFAIARYHRSFPFEVFRRHCDGAAPQVYWNAFRWPVEQSLGWMYQDYATLGIPPERIFPVGGLYQEGTTRLSEAGRSARLRAEDDSARLARGQLLVLRAHERRDVAGGRFGGDRRGEGGRYVKRRVRAGRRMDLSAVGPARAARGASRSAACSADRAAATNLHGATRRHALRGSPPISASAAGSGYTTPTAVSSAAIRTGSIRGRCWWCLECCEA